jgi:hypothetical protein
MKDIVAGVLGIGLIVVVSVGILIGILSGYKAWHRTQQRADANNRVKVTQIRALTSNTAVANALLAVTRRNHMRTTAQFKVGMWRTNFHERQREIAEAYRDAPIYDPKAVAAWKALGDDSMHRLHVLGGSTSYRAHERSCPVRKSADDMRKDVHEKRHYYLTQPERAILYGLAIRLRRSEQFMTFLVTESREDTTTGRAATLYPSPSL